MSEDTKKLTRCLTFIKENTTQVEKILDKLIEDEVIGLDERASILTNARTDNQLHLIIETVVRKQALNSFMEALKNTGNNHVVEKIEEYCKERDPKKMDKEKTYTILKTKEVGMEEKAQNEQILKEKTLEELKMENDRLKTQQSKIRDQLNEKHKKIQELRLEIYNYKRQNTELTERLESYKELKLRMQEIEDELKNKETMNRIIEISLSERSDEIFLLQTECDELKLQNEEKSEQISHLNSQMEALREELHKASVDRKKMEEKFEEMSNAMNEKFSEMMKALRLKGYKSTQRKSKGNKTLKSNISM